MDEAWLCSSAVLFNLFFEVKLMEQRNQPTKSYLMVDRITEIFCCWVKLYRKCHVISEI